MICVSTRNPNREVSFRDAIFEGLAPDGGLYVPKDPPHLRDLILSFSPATSFVEIAAQTTFALLEGELPRPSVEPWPRRPFLFHLPCGPWNLPICYSSSFMVPAARLRTLEPASWPGQ